MRRFASLLFLCAMLLAGGCSNGEEGVLAVHSAWARPTPPDAPTAAFYMTIENDSLQQDILGQVRSDRCNAVELHRTQVDEEGVMRMSPLEEEQLVIAPGENIVLQPGGLHIMCVGPSQPFVEGELVPLHLDFELAGSLAVTAEVRQDAP